MPVARRLLRLWPAVLWAVLLSAAAAAGSGAAPAGAAPMSECGPQQGTVVAVDFAPWHGPIVRGCGLHQPSGYALLHAAGFSTAGDAHDGDAFICRLGNRAFRAGAQYPTATEASCISTPSAGAYWSYWLAEPGSDRWIYSSFGPSADQPRPGEVELWTYGSTNVQATAGSAVPGFSPDSLRAASTTRVDDLAVASAEVPRPSTSAGSAAGLITATVVVAALLGGAGWTTWRRRRYQ